MRRDARQPGRLDDAAKRADRQAKLGEETIGFERIADVDRPNAHVDALLLRAREWRQCGRVSNARVSADSRWTDRAQAAPADEHEMTGALLCEPSGHLQTEAARVRR